MDTDTALNELLRAAKKLSPEQGRVARRNARTRALKALVNVRRAVDAEYPVVAKTARKAPRKRKLKTTAVVIGRDAVAELLTAGMSRNQIRKNKQTGLYWVAPWISRAFFAGYDTKLIVQAVRSKKARASVETMLRLGTIHLPTQQRRMRSRSSIM